MKIGQPTAICLSVIFFFVVAFIVAFIVAVFTESFFPNFSFSENPIIRIKLIAIVYFCAAKFYEYIYKNVENKEGKHEIAVYSDSDKKRKIAVV